MRKFDFGKARAKLLQLDDGGPIPSVAEMKREARWMFEALCRDYKNGKPADYSETLLGDYMLRATYQRHGMWIQDDIFPPVTVMLKLMLEEAEASSIV